jgi:hypothetical protein
MSLRHRKTWIAALLGAALFVAAAGPLSADEDEPTAAQSSTHERMHQMMDAMHGPGTSDRMHEAMGPEADQMMEQCAAMMDMMEQMMPEGPGMSPSMPGMMSQ